MDSIDDIFDRLEDSLADILKKHLDLLDASTDSNGFPLTSDFVRDIEEYELTHPDYTTDAKRVRQIYQERFKEKYNLTVENPLS